MQFWLDAIVRRSRLPYPIFFASITTFLYLLGVPFMAASNNLSLFFSEPRWVFVAVFGALNGILLIFALRGFSDSLGGIKHLIVTEDEFQKVKDRSLGRLTGKAYWAVVAFWLLLNFLEAPRSMRWWQFYNQPQLVTIYELIETLPCCVLGGIFMYVIPVGLNLAYRDLCQRTSFSQEQFVSGWMRPFKGFRRLIILMTLGAAVYTIFPPIIWGFTAEASAPARWTSFIPYTSIAVVLASAALFPHYFFHGLFSSAKQGRLRSLEERITETPTQTDVGLLRRILLLLEKQEDSRLKTWLLDVEAFAEIAAVTLIHVALVESVTILLHRA